MGIFPEQKQKRKVEEEKNVLLYRKREKEF